MKNEIPPLPAELDEQVRRHLVESLRSNPRSLAVLSYALDGGVADETGKIITGVGAHLSLGWYDDESKLTRGMYYRIDDQRVYVRDTTIEMISGKRLVRGSSTQMVGGKSMSYGFIRIVEPGEACNAANPPGDERAP